MKTVILLRHAKSSWNDPDLDDHERPLNRRGKAAAPAIARWLGRNGYQADRVLCSTSKRTRQTLKRMRPVLPDLPEAVVEPKLYHAAPGVMFEILAQQPDDAQCVLVIGHQPGLSAFARHLVNGRIRPGCARAFEHFPTAAAAVLKLPVERWRALSPHSAEFVDFAVPRALMAEEIVHEEPMLEAAPL
ncbi:MAG: histidine phosphatase family protein [Pseudomonadota bacterium]